MILTPQETTLAERAIRAALGGRAERAVVANMADSDRLLLSSMADRMMRQTLPEEGFGVDCWSDYLEPASTVYGGPFNDLTIHYVTRQSDEYACSCGTRWDVADGEAHP